MLFSFPDRLFPSENLALYYTKPKAGLQRAHGRLYDAVVNLKAKYRKHKVYQPQARRSLDKILTPELTSPSKQGVTGPPITEEEEECLEWLRCSSDDYALCMEKWRKTNAQRKQRVFSSEKESYLHEFPPLKRLWGHELVNSYAMPFSLINSMGWCLCLRLTQFFKFKVFILFKY